MLIRDMQQKRRGVSEETRRKVCSLHYASGHKTLGKSNDSVSAGMT